MIGRNLHPNYGIFKFDYPNFRIVFEVDSIFIFT